MIRYHVCSQCGFTQVRDEGALPCLSCDAPAEDVREYVRLADADAELGHLFKRPSVEGRGPSASDLVTRSRVTDV